ncbi:hypothetical protein B0H10DRAFT_2165197 [Mycena sp. CBHHK59/15]|nr:hypothetical protein B0H10DRAFT_2165197 [Mycena sp. CBHHK59/15]
MVCSSISLDLGLVKNFRVLIIDVIRIITVRLLHGMAGVTGTYVDSEDILIPQISFTATLPSGHTFHCLQFPFAPAYSTTFNSCQDLTLDIVSVDLWRLVFSHGQLYTALSHIRHRTHGKVLLQPGELQQLI